jgi:hypothetical protein
MAYEIRELSGSLFKNEKKTEEKHPQMQGSCLIEGVEYWVSAWTKEGTKNRWQSLAFKRKDAKQDAKPASIEQMDDDIPF